MSESIQSGTILTDDEKDPNSDILIVQTGYGDDGEVLVAREKEYNDEEPPATFELWSLDKVVDWDQSDTARHLDFSESATQQYFGGTAEELQEAAEESEFGGETEEVEEEQEEETDDETVSDETEEEEVQEEEEEAQDEETDETEESGDEYNKEDLQDWVDDNDDLFGNVYEDPNEA